MRAKLRKNLMGHKITDITEGVYGVVAPLSELRDAVELIMY